MPGSPIPKLKISCFRYEKEKQTVLIHVYINVGVFPSVYRVMNILSYNVQMYRKRKI